MNNFLLSLSIGIIAGLMATFLSAVIFQFWIKVTIPWFEELLYKDVKIEGRWEIKTEISGKLKKGILEIERNGHFVKGLVTHTDEGDQSNLFKITGSFRNLILTATYDTVNKSMISRGSLTLMLLKDGNFMSGWLAHYSFDKNKIYSTRYECKRI